MDLAFAKFIVTTQNPMGVGIFSWLTHLGGLVFIFIASVIIIVWLIWRLWLEEALLFGAGIFFAGLLTQFLKLLIGRMRPPDGARVLWDGYSFPSGHALGATVFYGFLLFLILRYSKNNWIRKLFSAILPLLILLIGASRVYLGVHWVTDVIAGWAIGGIILAAIIKIVGYIGQPSNSKS